MAAAFQLATRPSMTPREVQRYQFLTFCLGGETLAMEIRHVKEILQYGGITGVPLAPPVVRGVMNLRGVVIPVVDLAVRFGRPPSVPDRRTGILIVEVEEDEATTVMGVVVDQVREVLDIAGDEIDPPPAFGATLRLDFIRGVAKIGGRFVILLSAPRVFDSEELGRLDA